MKTERSASGIQYGFYARPSAHLPRLVDTLNLLTFKITEPPSPPVSLGRLWLLAVSAFGLATATILCCVGLLLSKSKQSISIAGRAFITISALAIIGSSVMGVRVCWWMASTFSQFAQFDTMNTTPDPEVVDPVIEQGGAMLSLGGGMLVFAATFLLLASVFGFRKLPDRASTRTTTLRWILVALPQVLLSLLFAFLFLLISFHGGALLDLITNTNTSIDPYDLVSHMNSICWQSLMGFVILLGIGVLWMVEAFVAPQAAAHQKID